MSWGISKWTEDDIRRARTRNAIRRYHTDEYKRPLYYCLDSNFSRWCSQVQWRASLTKVPSQVVLYCLSWLTDEDLYSASTTCHLFHTAFTSYTRGDNLIHKAFNSCTRVEKQKMSKKSKLLVRLSSRGHKFPRVEFLNVQFKHAEYYLFVRPSKFPALRTLMLRYGCVQFMPAHPNVKALYLIGCEFNAHIIFPFPNLQHLHLEDCTSEISSKNPLPKLDQLQNLVVKWSVVSQTLSKRRFPKLKRLVMKGNQVVNKLRLPHLEVLSMDLPMHYDLQALPNLLTLKLSKNGDNSFLERITEEKYPRLQKLVIDLGILWHDLDLSLLPPHSTMTHLRIASRGTVDVQNLTVENYPRLTTVDIDADEVDLTKLPPHHRIATLMVPKSTNTSAINKSDWPNIATINTNRRDYGGRRGTPSSNGRGS